MRLKPIKPGMVIHCKNDMEYEQLNAEVIKLGYGSLPCENRVNQHIVRIFVFCIEIDGVGWEYKSEVAGEITEFSDLIIHELSAEEVFEIMAEMHKECYGKTDGCLGCPIGTVAEHCDADCFGRNATAIIDVCEQWKVDHSKKEPEVEWVDVCRIIQIEDNGFKKCVHEQTMKNYENAEDEAGNILKWYVAENVGNYIAVVEHVCRVKQ